MPRNTRSTQNKRAATAANVERLEAMTDEPEDPGTIPTPVPIRRRKGKAPIGALGERLRSKAPVSSLPPSSPPRPSSNQELESLPTLSSDYVEDWGRYKYNLEEKENLDFPPHYYYPGADADADAGSGADDSPGPAAYTSAAAPVAQLDSNSASNPDSDSDPFGFLAVERQLKADRERQLKTGLAESREEDVPPAPPTPHKPKDRKSSFHDPERSLEEDSLPSSPSPSKVVSASRRRNPISLRRDVAGTNTSDAVGVDGGVDDGVGDDGDVEMTPVKGKKRGKKAALDVGAGADGTGTKTQTQTQRKKREKLEDPEEIAESLQALLPKRRVRKPPVQPTRSRRGRKAKEVAVAAAAAVVVAEKPAARSRRLRVRSEKVEEEEDEGVVQEREERLKYYKRLEDYSFEKENVYVI